MSMQDDQDERDALRIDESSRIVVMMFAIASWPAASMRPNSAGGSSPT